MQRLLDIKECDVRNKDYLDVASMVYHFIGGRRCRLAGSQTLHFEEKEEIIQRRKEEKL